ncbi:transporter substrate-binding domain-containing protein [Yoonia sp. I 8.24]|uniref:transporter substrate-binding domain-containing protein n=1 Tax=Yoonia sp. I 8.24 TaxID=1537229 RepID=UPI001EDD6657|nr:transporter substrate-binding domain-containing protein [Yoonia sp. I 8.24]MCG3267491.1 transporter substrate-binding domain-containing protein [Yoonia sp. I 8.24]
MTLFAPSLRCLCFGIASAGLSLSAQSATAQSISCGENYTIAAGDSLSGIAADVYGSASAFQLIYSANVDTIGPNPGLISRGQVIYIPCRDGSTTSQANDTLIRKITTTEQLDGPTDVAVRVVTATDWAPYFDESQAQGGMVTELTNVALASATGSPAYKIDFINDWGSHLQPLLTDHAYDFATAWYEPPCELIDQLGDDAKFRCNNFEWSDPMFEILLGYFGRTGEPLPATHAELVGKSICRPDGYETFVLEEDGLVEPAISFGQEGLITGCMAGLLDGTYDVVVIAVDPGQGAVLELGAQDDIMLNEQLTKVLNLSPVIAKSNPHREELLAMMNSGIAAIKSDGQWFEIVNRHLSAHRAQTQ